MCVYRFAPLLQKNATQRDPSKVIITGSVAGIGTGTVGESATFGYSASKAAVLHLARNLAMDLASKHILVNSIAPGFFPSKMANGLMEMMGGQENLAQLVPNGKLGEPEDFAASVVFLSSRAANHINATTTVIDGGSIWSRSSL